jgi:hypothetical protein
MRIPAKTEIYGWTANQDVSECFTSGTTQTQTEILLYQQMRFEKLELCL